jgi:hypothetical protein
MISTVSVLYASVVQIPDGMRFTGGNAKLIECMVNRERWLFKEFNERYRTQVDDRALTRMVEWRLSLTPSERAELDRMCAWPRAVVRRGGKVVGVLLPIAPTRFMRSQVVDGERKQSPRSLARLRLLDADLAAHEVDANVPEALACVGLTAHAILWLHEHGVVANDVQPENILVDELCTQVYLVDCDSMIGQGWGKVAPTAAPPYLHEVITAEPGPAVDMAKLAWCLIFILTRDFSLQGLGPEIRTELCRYMNSSTADLILRAARIEHGPTWIEFWRQRADLWVRACAAGSLVTDAGWILVDEARLADRERVQVRIPRSSQPVRDMSWLSDTRDDLPVIDGDPTPPPWYPPRKRLFERNDAAVLAAAATFVAVLIAIVAGYFLLR